MSRKRVLFITEFFSPPYDEGIKKTAFNLFKVLSETSDVKVICRDYSNPPEVEKIEVNAMFIGRRLWESIRYYKPDISIYMPFSSFTFGSYVRAIALQLYRNGQKYICIGLQPKKSQLELERICLWLLQAKMLTPSPSLYDRWIKLGASAHLVPLYTDLSRFSAIDEATRKTELRTKYGIPLDKFIVTHIGHLSTGRNLRSLIPIQAAGFQVVIVSSTSTPVESVAPGNLSGELRKCGIIVLTDYVDDIKEVYQMSDLYVFPVVDECSSIGLPLSILEARACGVPVLTTEYGSVKYFLGNDMGGVFYSSTTDFVNQVERIRQIRNDVSPTSVHAMNDKLRLTLKQVVG